MLAREWEFLVPLCPRILTALIDGLMAGRETSCWLVLWVTRKGVALSTVLFAKRTHTRTPKWPCHIKVRQWVCSCCTPVLFIQMSSHSLQLKRGGIRRQQIWTNMCLLSTLWSDGVNKCRAFLCSILNLWLCSWKQGRKVWFCPKSSFPSKSHQTTCMTLPPARGCTSFFLCFGKKAPHVLQCLTRNSVSV